jgi:crossover junction endodeoxyribonuclease RusA
MQIILPFPCSVNTAFATDFKTKRRFRSKAYNKWHKRATDSLWGQKLDFYGDSIVKLEIAFKRPDKRRRDLSNFIKVVEDFLVEMKIIEDDSQIHHLTAYWSDDDFNGARVGVNQLYIS